MQASAGPLKPLYCGKRPGNLLPGLGCFLDTGYQACRERSWHRQGVEVGDKERHHDKG